MMPTSLPVALTSVHHHRQNLVSLNSTLGYTAPRSTPTRASPNNSAPGSTSPTQRRGEAEAEDPPLPQKAQI